MPESTLNARSLVKHGQAAPGPQAIPADDGVEVVPLPEVLRQIGRDSAKEPRQYLDETRVPLGGE
jgi:hypothetical protein